MLSDRTSGTPLQGKDLDVPNVAVLYGLKPGVVFITEAVPELMLSLA